MGNVISEFGRLVLGVGRDIQCKVMPDYTSVDPGIIVQYTGATDANYINGYFYKNTSSGWVQENVQPETNVSGKADKVSGATTDDLAKLTATGDLADSGKKLSDLVLKADVKDVLNSTSTTDPLSANQGRVLNENIEAIVNVYGAKNLAILDFGSIMPINTSGTWSGNVYSHRSVDFTVTDNGVSVSGTASGGAAFIDIPLSPLTNGEEYIANGISGGADETYQIKFLNSSLVVQSVSDLYDGERTFEKNSTNQNVEIYRIRVASGANVTTDIYPMIRDARILDPTFAPYAKTNQQLTNDKAERSDLATLKLTGSTNSTGSTINAGTYFYLNGSFCKAKTAIANGATFTLNTNFEVVSVGGELANMAFHKIAENGTYSTVTADTWEYTGVSFTIPAKTFYGLRGESGWQNGRSTGLAISAANDALRTYECLTLYEDANGAAYCSATGYSAANLTVYLWSKRQGTGSNPYTLNGWYVNE